MMLSKRLMAFLYCLSCFLVVMSLYISARSLTSRSLTNTNVNCMVSTTGNHQTCTSATKIVYVKTHKTGSTTTGTLFERYGEKHSLVFALPKNGHIFSSTELFNRTMVTNIQRGITLDGKKLNGYNIIANHARYNRPEMDAVVPNAKFVTILREPTAQLESAFGYYHMAEALGLEDTPNALETFMKTPRAHFESQFFMSHLALNAQLYDLGLDHQFHSDIFLLHYTIRKLENEFDLVMIMEYYDESLILLKQTLCLEYDDIIYLKKDERQQQSRYEVSPELRARMRRWNSYDIKLYNHFNKTFWKKVNANRKQFDQELNEFRKLQDDVTEKCVECILLDDGSIKKRLPLDVSKRDVRFCKSMFMGDGRFIKRLRRRYTDIGLIEPHGLDGSNQNTAWHLPTQPPITCSPATQIVFVKTHKTGSTTVATMLQRYGKNHRLIFALPKKGHFFSIKELFNREMVAKIRTGVIVDGKNITGYNILTNHARYNRLEMDAVVPNAKFVTILREPTAQLESAFAYFGMAETLGLANTSEPVAKFMQKPREYMNRSYTNYSMVHIARNGQLFDLGLDPNLHGKYVVRDKIREIETQFDLVMIMEYFDESLVLLKNILCLELDDIVYHIKGSRSNRYEMDPKLQKSIRKWNFADIQLYEHFNKSLWNIISNDRERFNNDLAEFRIRQREVTDLCVKKVTSNGENKQMKPLKLTQSQKYFCKSIYVGDGRFVKHIRQEYIDVNIFDSTD